ncbi:hypothetical protein F951_02539 [Acinetobacter soli CIP 110264]|uniref:TetR/AcrR family transcriptional regulator n=2 Tax=Acinetobacter soli TaxID=487316 RepID=UPI0002D0FBA7|nr:TetR/AcrR family transcriptional regulator [Acinetobacter soli]ENV56839.1 hypothetical protein F951_02539 [Acinetobacter soli CIP 110264]
MQRNLKRSRIMQVATDLFSSFGYHAVGVDWIIRDADISKNTLYKYFFSKENLILEVLKERDRACRESLSQLIPNELPPIQKLELVFDWHNEWFTAKNFTGCLFAKAINEFPSKTNEINRVATQQKEQLIHEIEQILSELMDDTQAKNVAPIMMMLLDGATLSAQIIGNRHAALDAWNAAKRLIQQT